MVLNQPITTLRVAARIGKNVAAFTFGTWVALASAADPVPEPPTAAIPTPSWDTQKQARVWAFTIPAPRGQICDRNGSPLALQRVGYNLGISFPRPLNFSDEEVTKFITGEAEKLGKVLGRELPLQPGAAQKHYHNRALLPWVMVQNLTEAEQTKVQGAQNPAWELLPFYARYYPNGKLAGHVLGYVGRMGRFQDGPVENGEGLWPDAEGREGLEKTFDQLLRGEPGQMNVTYNGAGKKASETVGILPVAGKNVITTIDLPLQRLCEAALAAGTKRGAMVVMEPESGDILALASWPPIDPNQFVPSISEADYNAMKHDPNEPLFPRFSLAAYPPGSTFKCFVGLAGLSSGRISSEEQFDCPTGLQIGDRIFHNWKKEGTGNLNFAEALEQSCNTWFYQAGMKMGSEVITEFANGVGFGEKTGIPIPEENAGIVPDNEYMHKHGMRMVGGQLAMLAIGQGSTEITPLQMAQAMATVGNGGTLFQARLVKQVQDITGEVVSAYGVRVRRRVEISPATLAVLRSGMTNVVAGGRGTAHQAKVEKVNVAGKTGTAQWRNRRTVAWFAGYAPAEGPRLAFSVVYEGDPDRNDVHGGSHAAPMVGKVLREYFKDPVKMKPIPLRDANGNELEIPTILPTPKKALPVPAEMNDGETVPQEATPAPVPQKSQFWKRIFG